MTDKVRAATKTLFERYRDILIPLTQPTCGTHVNVIYDWPQINDAETSAEHLLWMCSTAIENIEAWPIDKLSRWLGFVQGVLSTGRYISVETERNFSRPLFHEAYREAGAVIPETKDRDAAGR